MLNRRQLLGAGLAITTLALPLMNPGLLWAQNAPNLGTPDLPTPGFRKLRMGAVDIIALNDGIARRPLGEEFVKNAPLDQVKALLASQGLATDHIDVPFTAFLVVAGGKRFLLDAGFGDNGGPTTGRLQANLAAAGYKPEDIDHVVISHYHGDHINGLRMKNGQLAYPNAKVHVPAPEHAFWMDDARMEAAPQAMKGAFGAVRRVFKDMPADKLVRFEPGAELAPGIRSNAAFGHTPGMSTVTVTSEGKSFIFVADLTNVPALFARNPDWAVMFDMDAEAARLTRRRVFDQIVQNKMLAGGYHFPFPAFGTIEPDGQGFRFVPVT
ncbi:MAG TPA: MBL fold metallo-hydrolase [Burkholderiaceae bacterium]|nr:MBL fold metallo-hydrolase [Burkholderiaceae bacterium]